MFVSGKIKRFYKEAEAVEAEGGFTVALDGKQLRSPARSALALPSRSLAEALAAEWAAQGETLDPKAMALTSLAYTALDIVRPRRAEVVAELAAYGETDLVCYRVERPDVLVARQQAVWQPLLDWAALELNAPLVATSGLLMQPQPPEALAALGRAVERHDDLALAGLDAAVKTSGSLVIGLALSADRLDPTGAFEAAELHETYQIEAWGEDQDATKRRDKVRAEIEAANRFLTLLQS